MVELLSYVLYILWFCIIWDIYIYIYAWIHHWRAEELGAAISTSKFGVLRSCKIKRTWIFMLVDAAIIAEEIVFSHEKYLHYIFLFKFFFFTRLCVSITLLPTIYIYIYMYTSFYFWVGKCSEFFVWRL